MARSANVKVEVFADLQADVHAGCTPVLLATIGGRLAEEGEPDARMRL